MNDVRSPTFNPLNVNSIQFMQGKQAAFWLHINVNKTRLMIIE